MIGEYLKWTVILFVLRIIVETIIQAFVMKKGFVVCKLNGTDPAERGVEWLKTARQGKIVVTLQVVTLLISVVHVYQCLYSAPAENGFFGPNYKTIKQKLKQWLCGCCCRVSGQEKVEETNEVSRKELELAR